jgi:hypothetical protein
MRTIVRLPNDEGIQIVQGADSLQKLILKAAGSDAERAFMEYRKENEDQLILYQKQIKEMTTYVYEYKMAMDTLLGEIMKHIFQLKGEFPNVSSGIRMAIAKIKEWS